MIIDIERPPKIVVVAQVELCPAAVALHSECLDFELVIADNDYTYGRTLKRLWEEGERFINIEHDIVPWPGACEHIWQCTLGHCVYPYPIGYSGKLGGSLGMIMLDPNVWQGKNLAEGWDETKWNYLDAAVYGSLKPKPHRHMPPVAHLTPLKKLYDQPS